MEINAASEERITLAGKNGESDIDFDPFSKDGWKKMDDFITKEKERISMNKNFEKDMNVIKQNLIDQKYLNEDLTPNEEKTLAKGDINKVKSWSRQHPELILEAADNGKFRIFERKSDYDVSSSFVEKSKIEIAEDDRVLGIPYAQAMAGDRVFIINGKVFTGWALYFSLSSIKSPEDYARNVDLVFNVPYLYASILLKAQLGLGCGIDVNYGAESLEVPEEKLIRRYLFQTLRLNVQKLVKTGFHLYTYGNAYWALRRDTRGLPDKLTILQPERLKIFLDPMTTKIMFYIYLPPIIGGTTIASYPSDGRVNPNILTGMTLSYPTPIVMHPEDVMHFKINDFTEYPFGFSDIKTCIDPATARLDVNILAPILYKKYTKPMIHWALTTEGLGPRQVEEKKTEMVEMLQSLEPGSDPVTTDRWKPTIISISSGKESILDLTGDIDTQIFASTGCPETYFKPKGSTDRMISEQDKTFISRMKIPQSLVAEQIEEKLIKPRLFYEIQQKKEMKEYVGESDVLENTLTKYDSWLASEPKYPEVKWKEVFKQDETQSIANAIALLNAGIIDIDRAAMKIGEIPMSQQAKADLNKIGLDDPLSHIAKIQQDAQKAKENSNPMGQQNFNEQENMEMIRGGLNVGGNFATSNRNVTQTKDPSQLGGSRYAQHETKGDAGDIQQKHKPAFQDGLFITKKGESKDKYVFQENEEIDFRYFEDGIFIRKK